MAQTSDNSLMHHMVSVKTGARRMENAFEGVSRMILESDIEKVVVNGKTTYDFSIFRAGRKHLLFQGEEELKFPLI